MELRAERDNLLLQSNDYKMPKENFGSEIIGAIHFCETMMASVNQIEKVCFLQKEIELLQIIYSELMKRYCQQEKVVGMLVQKPVKTLLRVLL